MVMHQHQNKAGSTFPTDDSARSVVGSQGLEWGSHQKYSLLCRQAKVYRNDSDEELRPTAFPRFVVSSAALSLVLHRRVRPGGAAQLFQPGSIMDILSWQSQAEHSYPGVAMQIYKTILDPRCRSFRKLWGGNPTRPLRLRWQVLSSRLSLARSPVDGPALLHTFLHLITKHPWASS